MAEEAVVVTPPVQQENNGSTTIPSSPFGNSWSETPPEIKNETVVPAVNTPAAQPVITPPESIIEEEILDPKDWLKRELDIDDIDLLKSEREELKKLRETSPTEIKFADEQSKVIHELIREGKKKEVREFLDTQDKLETLSTANVDKDNAEAIIKLCISLKNKNLTPQEVDFQYKQDYTTSKEPVQKTAELDEDFEERLNEWKEKAATIETKRVIAAKMLQPELEKLKSQIVLPELSKKPDAPTQESLDAQIEAAKKIRENFLNKLESDYAKLDGFVTTVKDELVEIPVAFKVPDEAKVAIKERLKAGFDLNDFLDKRWSDSAGIQKIENIMSDIFILENLDKILSGVANNAANQRLVEHRKQAGNIHVNGKTSQETFEQNNNNGKVVSPYAKNAWSETPPPRNN